MIAQSISSLPVVVGRYDNDFVQAADDFLNKLPNFCTELNTYANEANSLRNEMNNSRDKTKNYRDKTEAYKITACNCSVKAVNAWNNIQNYVIPTEATYSIEQIDAIAEEAEINDFLGFIEGETDEDTLNKIKKVDGPDSGLNADMLDGKHAKDLANVNLSNVTNNTMGNKLEEIGELNSDSIFLGFKF